MTPKRWEHQNPRGQSAPKDPRPVAPSILPNVEPTRHEFLHLGTADKAVFYTLIVLSTAYLVYGILGRSKEWKQGKPLTWKPEPIKNILNYILAQRKVRSSRPRSGAPMHLLIFYGFLSLLIATTLLALSTYAPLLGIPSWHKGQYYLTFETVFDLLGLLFVVGVSWAMFRRWGFRLRQMAHEWRDSWALIVLFLLGIGGYLLEAGRMAANPQPFDTSAPIGFALSQLLPKPLSAQGYAAIWWFHVVTFIAFWAGLPHMRLKHIILAIFSSAGSPDRPMGKLVPISMEEVEQTGKIGVNEANEFSRWHLLSMDACMGCGRCTEVCPAWNVGKSLNPQKIVADSLTALRTNTPLVENLTEEALWACTTCNACVEACPVLIRHTDVIVDTRRYLVAEGKLSGGPSVMLRQTGSTGNAWGASSSSREDWMKDLSVPLAREHPEFEYLFWVGCAGATDPGAIKTTRAVAELLNKAGVNYACLGQEETCTGDSARRVGDEFLFQEMAAQNVANFHKYKVKKVITACPHCLNTLKNEYCDFDANLEVIHHTELLADLVAAGKLQGLDAGNGAVAYHDPCYLGRVNSVHEAPRNLFRKGQLAEPVQNRHKTLCCGAGGGRMWMEEPPDQRPSNRRAEQLLATGAKTVALGCPFCKIMLDAGVKQVTDEEIVLVDLAELLQKANA